MRWIPARSLETYARLSGTFDFIQPTDCRRWDSALAEKRDIYSFYTEAAMDKSVFNDNLSAFGARYESELGQSEPEIDNPLAQDSKWSAYLRVAAF